MQLEVQYRSRDILCLERLQLTDEENMYRQRGSSIFLWSKNILSHDIQYRTNTGVSFVTSLSTMINLILWSLNDSIDILEDWARDTTVADRQKWTTLDKRKIVFLTDSCSPDGRELGRVFIYFKFFLSVHPTI